MFLEVEVWGKVKPDIGKNYSILANGKEAVVEEDLLTDF